jgi:hypothetical protein
MGYVVIWIIMGIIVAMIANSKGKSPMSWFFYGLLLWPIALVHILITKEPVAEGGTYSDNPSGPRRCPSCEKIVHGVGDTCPYCTGAMNGQPLPEGQVRPCSNPKCFNTLTGDQTKCACGTFTPLPDPEVESDERECPECAELIKKRAKKCKHCGSEVEPMLTP